jgi:hypothetical protein
MAYKPDFTIEQKSWISNQIDDWYLRIKNNVVNYNNRTHRLGSGKEVLKALVCDELDELRTILAEMNRSDNDESC